MRATAALPALLLLACGAPSEAPAPPLTALPIHLVDHLDAVRVEGLAQVLRQPPEVPLSTRQLLQVDFEDGTLGPLIPFGGVGVPADTAAAAVQVVAGPRAFGTGRSAELRGGVPHGVSLRSPPLPVRPTETYGLRYRVAAEDAGAVESARALEKVHAAAPSVLLYRIPEGEAVEAVLADPRREIEARVPPPEDLFLPSHLGTRPWTEGAASFTSGALATHMVLSFDLGRSDDDRSPYYAQGTLLLDDVVLSATDVPPPLRHRAHDDGLPAFEPLLVAATLAHAAHPRATEQRFALAVPAPSTLRFRVVVPAGAVLDLGYGLLPEAWAPGAPPVEFAVEVLAPGSDPQQLHRESVAPEPRVLWRDVRLDLGGYAGKTVELALRTAGREPGGDPARDLLRLPEAAAVVAYPVLHVPAAGGRLFVLAVVDTLPAKRSSSYGYERDTTPELSRIARDGVIFERALSSSPWTLPAFASLLTGLDPVRHHAGELLFQERDVRRPLAGGFVTVVERLRSAGFETRGWINNPHLAPRLGLAQGFSHYVDYQTLSIEDAAEPGVADLLRFLAVPRGHDTFVLFHFLDPHGPYRPDPEYQRRFVSPGYTGSYREPLSTHRFGELTTLRVRPDAEDRRRIRELYEAVVAYTDHQLGRIYDAARASAGRGELAFLVTADHGEELWDRELLEHGHSLYDEQLRVPLVLVRNGGAPGAVAAAVATRDVAATLLALAGQDSEPGAPPLPEVGDRDAEPARSFLAGNLLYGVERLSLERNGVKYVYNQRYNGTPAPRAPRPAVRHELYRIAEDPGETRNLFAEEPALGLSLHEELARRALPGLAGDYVVGLDGGGRVHRFEGSLTLPAGSEWRLFAKDLIWPLRSGGEAEFQLRRDWQMGRAVIQFSVVAQRALLGLAAAHEPGGIEAAFRIDGERAGPGVVRIGAAREPAGEGPANVPDARLWLEPADLFRDPEPGPPQILLGRLRPAPELAAETLPEGLPGALREQLRALGYLDDGPASR